MKYLAQIMLSILLYFFVLIVLIIITIMGILDVIWNLKLNSDYFDFPTIDELKKLHKFCYSLCKIIFE